MAEISPQGAAGTPLQEAAGIPLQGAAEVPVLGATAETTVTGSGSGNRGHGERQ